MRFWAARFLWSSGRQRARLPPLDRVREAGTDNASAHRRAPSPSPVAICPRVCGAFADERRIAAGDGGEEVRTRNVRQFPRLFGSVHTTRFCRSSGRQRLDVPPSDPMREAGARIDDALYAGVLIAAFRL